MWAGEDAAAWPVAAKPKTAISGKARDPLQTSSMAAFRFYLGSPSVRLGPNSTIML